MRCSKSRYTAVPAMAAAISVPTSVIEPLMVITVGCVVGFIAMSIMLPIFNMSKIVK